jgi:hypothetical protein
MADVRLLPRLSGRIQCDAQCFEKIENKDVRRTPHQGMRPKV